jgi:hypothetical protein
MYLTKTLVAGALCALACRGSNDSRPETVETAPPRERTDSVAPPTDFAIQIGGGPVAGEMAANMVLERTRIEPRPGSPGEFDVVVIAVGHDHSGFESGTREVRRVPAPAARVAALYRIVRDRRAELEGPCMNLEIMDGATVGISVHENGLDHEFRCTNASTPAFEALSTGVESLARDALGS